MKRCLQCNKEIPKDSYSKLYNKFCNHSCAATYTNSIRKLNLKDNTCKNCGETYKNSWKKPQQFCSTDCSAEYRKKAAREINLKLFQEGKLKYRNIIYNFLIERDGNSCSVCKITKWNNKPIRLWVDHVDGNASNNMPENFRLICPNCESQTDTSRGRNLGSGRKSRGLPCYG
jgi:hypothetical protein